jgi:hypothetical protein
MRNLLITAVAATALGAMALGATVPANAQVGIGIGPGGAGVQVGPFGAGIGPAYDPWGPHYRWGGAYAYDDDCRIVRERVITPGGRHVITTRRVCY